jgi:hypothetical protein
VYSFEIVFDWSQVSAAEPGPAAWWRAGTGNGKYLSLLLGAGGGLSLGLLAHGYMAFLRYLPATAERMR